MTERTSNTVDFATLVNEGLGPDVLQTASYWAASFKTNEAFRKTVLAIPFQTLGVYLIAKAQEKTEQTKGVQKESHTFENAVSGFSTMIGLKAYDQTYHEFCQSNPLVAVPNYDDMLGVVSSIKDLKTPEQEIQSVKEMRKSWGVDTPPQLDQIDRLAALDYFMQSFNSGVQQILKNPLLFSHAYRAVEMGVDPRHIDTIMPDRMHMHYLNSATGIRLQVEGHVADYYQPEKATALGSSLILSAELIRLVEENREGDDFNSIVQRLSNALYSKRLVEMRKLSLKEKQRIAEEYVGDKSSWEKFMQEIQALCHGNPPPLAIPILFKEANAAFLKQYSHHLLLTRDDMAVVDKLARDRVIETQLSCATGDVIGFMDQVFQDREL